MAKNSPSSGETIERLARESERLQIKVEALQKRIAELERELDAAKAQGDTH